MKQINIILRYICTINYHRLHLTNVLHQVYVNYVYRCVSILQMSCSSNFLTGDAGFKPYSISFVYVFGIGSQ